MNCAKLAAVALAVAVGVLANPSAAQQADGQVGVIHAWPALSPWITLMIGLPNGSAVCSAATQTPPLGPAGYSVAFVLSGGGTHFYLTMSDRSNVAAQKFQLVGERGVFADMPVISQQAALGTTIADIPGDNFIKQIVPEMLKDQEISLRAGDRSFPVPHARFAEVVDQIRDCADEYRKRYGPAR